MSPIERAARAAFEAEWEGEFPADGTIQHAMAMQIARAAVLALREPSSAMVEAGNEAIVYHPDDFIRNQAEPCWNAMIDKALSE